MTTQTPRAPRSPATRPAAEAPAVIDAHGAIEVLDGPPVIALGRLHDNYTGRWMVCRKPFKLNGEAYRKGDPVPVDMIPRPDSWVHTGYIEDAKAS